jgi:predicted metal-dependent HD superfamily phosphohydrolase
MVIDTEIVSNAAEYVRDLLGSRLSYKYPYHTIEHTEETVEGCRVLAEAHHLGTLDLDTLLIAAWFHDTGYVDGHENHEERSVAYATEFLTAQGYPPDRIAMVAAAIRATRYPQSPANTVEMILCDADMMHLGRKRYVEKERLLRAEEFEARGRTFSDAEWLASNIEFLGNHRFHTRQARDLFDPQRHRNIAKLQKRLREELLQASEPVRAAVLEKPLEKPAKVKKAKAPAAPPVVDDTAPPIPAPANGASDMVTMPEAARKAKEKLDKEKGKTERGIETMFRTTAKNHLDLSSMADTKANILITINSLIISIVLSLLIRKLEETPELLIPTVMIMLVCVVTIVFGVIATRPKINSGVFTPEDVKQKKVNLLFFGNFYSMSLKDYEWGMQQMMNDREYLYGSMIADIYYLGKVLERKYRYIRLAYNIFMYGLVVSVLAYGVAYVMMP